MSSSMWVLAACCLVAFVDADVRGKLKNGLGTCLGTLNDDSKPDTPVALYACSKNFKSQMWTWDSKSFHLCNDWGTCLGYDRKVPGNNDWQAKAMTWADNNSQIWIGFFKKRVANLWGKCLRNDGNNGNDGVTMTAAECSNTPAFQFTFIAPN